MTMGASIRRLMLREALAALLALSLLALNFGHSSAVLAAHGRVVVTEQSSLCGDPMAPAPGEHFPCHACRPDAAALPPMPAVVIPVAFAVAPVAYAAPVRAAAFAPPILSSSPRGPPVSA